MENEKNYNIGLDIGTGSVGWAVTDENNNLLKYKGKNMWGSRIFNEAKTAEDTRLLRGTRRRIERRKERINMLQSLLLDDMEKEYPNFFPMLKETSCVAEDKLISDKIDGEKYNLFSELNMNDKIFYREYPTIYHLRNYLINSKEKVDIRLVYLAIHHIIKYRGNFLYEGEFDNSNEENVKLSISEINSFLLDDYGITCKDEEKTIKILKNKNISKSEKKNELINNYTVDSTNKNTMNSIISAIVGYSFDITKIWDREIDKNKISFSNEVDNEDEIIETIGDKAYIYYDLKKIYSWATLQEILEGKTLISEAFIAKYEKYAIDLKKLKEFYKKYIPEKYNEMFRKEGTTNYLAYTGDNCKKCSTDDFYKNINKDIEGIDDSNNEKIDLKEKIEDRSLLVKTNSTDNSAIPYQLHKEELVKIIDNQSQYYKTIKENKEEIISLLEFRIPYYVGPLKKKDDETRFSWVIRKSDEKITPWNFHQIIDEDATAEEFIKRMTNKCTYLINEDVLPRNSLLYSEFCVRNELKNIRVNNHRLSKDTTEKIINGLFKNHKKVSIKQLKKFYITDLDAIKEPEISGLSDGESFSNTMTSYNDMIRIFEKIEEEKDEKLIEWITIFEDKKILKHKIMTEYKDITDMQLKELMNLRYSGWARLSRKLLNGIKSKDYETIMEKLINTPDNFMQIINNEEYGFDKIIEDSMPTKKDSITYEDVENIPTSPSNKRAIWQSMKIVKEIIKVMKYQPKNIYIEFARSEEEKNQMKDNRAKKLLKIYEDAQKMSEELISYDSKIYKELKDNQNLKDFTDRLYLYIIQNGKSLYSRKKLNIDELNLYEIDHILPQSLIKDDSLDNRALVLKDENQRKSGSQTLSDDIINSQMDWWKSLLEHNMMSQKKYYNLIRRKLVETEDDKVKFIARQLVETRQITKYVTNLLLDECKDSNIFTIRANITHGIREKYKLYKNRNVNNYHHAQDAYIISTAGNIIDQTYKREKGKFIYNDYVKSYFDSEKYKNKNNDNDKKWGIIDSITYKIDIEKLKKVMQYKDFYYSRMLEEQTGEFYSQTLYGPNDKKYKPVISLKEGKDVSKYGGYSGENKAYSVIYSYKNNSELIGIPIKIAYQLKSEKNTLKKYISKIKNIDENEIIINKDKIMKYQEFINENNEPMVFLSDSEIGTNKQLIIEPKMQKLIFLINEDSKKISLEDKEEIENNWEYMYDYLIEKIKKEYKTYISVVPKLENAKEEYFKLNNNDKTNVINGIISIMSSGSGNLSKIKLALALGRQNMKHFQRKQLQEYYFVDKSITGMYERRYKINGMENSYSK